MDSIKLSRWQDIIQGPVLQRLETTILPGYLTGMRWFGGKGRQISSVKIVSHICVPAEPLSSYFLLLKVDYRDMSNERYILPVCFLRSGRNSESQMKPPVLCELQVDLERGWLSDAVWCADFRMSLFRMFARQAEFKDNNQQINFTTSNSFAGFTKDIAQTSRLLHAEQSNTSIIYGNKLFLKLYRKVETGINPDIELSKFLSEDARFNNVPKWLGSIEWQSSVGAIGVGILQEMLSDVTVAWDYFQPMIREAVDSSSIDGFRNKIAQLATLTADMHRALANHQEPEDINETHQMIERLKKDVSQTFDLLKRSSDKLPQGAKDEAYHLLELKPELEHMLADTDVVEIPSKRMRVHGDFHLGQVLVSGDNFKVTDFEGEPGRTYAERRMCQSVLKDVAGMVRSFQYATYSKLMDKEGNHASLQQLADVYHKMSDMYVDIFLNSMNDSGLIPQSANDSKTLLRLFLVEKALYELRYELNNRPDWTIIPIAGLVSIISEWMESGVHHA